MQINTTEIMIDQAQRPYPRFREIYIHKNDIDTRIRCDVCCSKAAEEDEDLIVICESCNVATH